MGNMNCRDLWEIHQGVFVPSRPEYSNLNPYQRKAKMAGDLLVEHFQCEGVFLRGSGIHPHVDYHLEDLDLILCYDSQNRESDFPAEEEIELLLNEKLPFQMEWDLRLHDMSHSFEEMNILTYFFLQLRSMFLAGTDIREIGIEIDADINTAIYLYNGAVKPLLPIFDFYDDESISEFLPWLQKRTLRLLSFHALAQKNMFSRELTDCVQFGEVLYPELKDGFLEIYHDYIGKHGDKGYATMIVLQEILARDIVTGKRETVQYQSEPEVENPQTEHIIYVEAIEPDDKS